MRRFRGASGGRLAANPYAATASLVARNPRAAVLLGGFAAATVAMVLLIVASSAQAFLMISGQSANNTQNRLALVVDNDPDATADEIEALAAGVDGAATPLAGQGADGGAVAGSNAGAAPPTGTVGPDDVVAVRGIRVHRSIADDIRALLDAAEADGILLSGWGWRDGQTQIRLRREHCGTTEYAIYRMPSSQCRPPTARPGRSQHERGLAIDFTYNGGSISSRRNTGFKWLNANAATYGLKNLASEPWHWSTTGR